MQKNDCIINYYSPFWLAPHQLQYRQNNHLRPTRSLQAGAPIKRGEISPLKERSCTVCWEPFYAQPARFLLPVSDGSGTEVSDV